MSLPPSLPAAPAAPVVDGRLLPGTYTGRLERIDLAALSRRWLSRRRRWKQWHYVSIAGPELFLAVAVVDLGWAGSAFAYLFDRGRRRLVVDRDVVRPGGRGASVAALPGPAARTAFSSRRLSVRLAGEGGRWRLEARSPGLTVDATLEETPAGPTLCAVAPVPGGVVDCTHKTPALRIEGVAGAGGVVYDLAGAHGALDHTSGLLARRTTWRWASGTDGAVSLNLTEGFTAPLENALWVGGRIVPLPAVTFLFDAAMPDAPWRITSDDGDVDLEFVPEGLRRKRTSLIVAESNYVQPVGTFRGSVAGTVLDGLPGVTEDHLARW